MSPLPSLTMRSWSYVAIFHYQLNPALASSRPPVTVLPLSEAVGTALVKSAFLICAAVALGWTLAYSAAAAVTCGIAIEGPL